MDEEVLTFSLRNVLHFKQRFLGIGRLHASNRDCGCSEVGENEAHSADQYYLGRSRRFMVGSVATVDAI